jgi:recombination protein RecT
MTMDAQTKAPSEIMVVRHQIDDMATQFQAALPAHIPVERFARVVMTAIQNNGDLLKCSRRSLFNAAMKAAQDGLLPDGREGAMVPFKGDVTWMPMVGGIRKKVRNSGEIATWDVHAVYEKDLFEYELGDDPFIKHKPNLVGDRGQLIAVYSIATLKTGEKSRDVMSRTDVDKIKALSKGSNTPWNNPTFYPEMAKKTVARRHSKVLPMSSDLDDLIRRDDHLYDLDGAREEAQVDRPKSLAGRLDALADFSDAETIDAETGEVLGDKKPAADKAAKKSDAGSSPSGSDEPGKQGSAAKPAGKSPSEESQASPSTSGGDDDPIAMARREGAEAKARKMSRKALPAKYRQNDDLMEAWLLGFDTGEAERQPGEEG